MRVLMISTDRNILEDGSAPYARMKEYGSLVEELHVVIFTKMTHIGRLHISKNVSVYPTNSYSRWLYILDAYRIGRAVLSAKGGQSAIGDQKCLISCQDPFETGLVGAWLKHRFGVPLQIQLHTDLLSSYFARQSLLNRARTVIARFVLKRADGIRVVSERIKASLQGMTNVSVLPIFVDFERFGAQGGSEKKMPFPQTILMVSRLVREKNVALAIRAFASVAERFQEAGMCIVGSGNEASRLKDLAHSMGMDKRVIFAGSVSSYDLPAFLYGACCFLSTSNYEGYGMALVEAAGAGLAIVTTDVGAVGDVVRESESALVCPVGDEACLADRLAEVLRDGPLRAHLGKAARRRVQGHAMTKQEYLQRMRKGWELCITPQQA